MRHLLESASEEIRANLLISITLCYVIGAVAAKYFQIGITLMQPITVALILSYLALLFFHKKHRAHIFLLPLFLVTGYIHTSHGLLPPEDPTHLFNKLSERSRVTLIGRVLNMPEYDGQTTRFDLSADSILFHDEQPKNSELQPTHGKIRLSLDGFLSPTIKPGNHIMLLASAGRIYNYRTPGVFDYRLYLAEKNIHVSGNITSSDEIIPFQDIDSSVCGNALFIPEQWRYHINTFLQEKLAPETAGIYQALLTGSRSGISDNTLERFKATGVMHLLAISGIHMSLLGLMITLGLTWIMKRSTWLLIHSHVPTLATLLTLVPLTTYALIAGLNTPVLRSLLMSALFLIGIVLQRQRSILFIIAAAALFLLIWKPLALFTVSFQLSFASILAIAILYPRLLKQFEQDNLRSGNKIQTYISSAFFVSIAASLGALPFMLFHFNRFSLIGPVMNLLVEPFLCLWALPLGLLAIPLIFIVPEAATLLLKSGSLGILAADKITLAGSKIPFSSLWTTTPSLVECIIFYLLLYLMLMPAGKLRTKIILIPLFFCLTLSFIQGLFFTIPYKSTELSFLDVGQGSSTIIRTSNGRTIMIDGGSNTSQTFNIGERVIAPFLWKKQIWRLDDIIITHPHSDHANGIDFILRKFKPERLWINGDLTQDWPYEDILSLAAALGITIIKPETGRTIDVSPDTRFTFLNGADTSMTGLSANNRSLVIRMDHNQKSFLFPGDIGNIMEKKLVQNGAHLEADLLLAPHHGSKGSGSRQFIDTVNPEIIIISAGNNSRKRYIDPQHLSTWFSEGRTVLTTADSGSITCRMDGVNFDLKTFSDRSEIK